VGGLAGALLRGQLHLSGLLVSDFPRPPRRPVLVPSELTLEDLSRQITLVRFDLNDRLDAFHSELSMVRAILTDQVPRVAAVEKSAGAKVVGATKWLGVATLVLTVAAQIASAFRPNLVGPIQSLINILTGAAG